MRDIHKDGTPTAVAAPASNPRIRRRVIGTGWDHEAADRAEGIGRYMARRHPTWNRRLHFQPIQFICTVAKRPWDERPVFPVPCLNGWGHEIQLSLTFLSHRGLTPALLGKTFFSTRRPALETGGQRPTARCALGRKIVWTTLILRSRVAASRRMRPRHNRPTLRDAGFACSSG